MPLPQINTEISVHQHPDRTGAMQSDYVRIFDTTLRDGEQSPGATMTPSEKLEVAKVLSRLGVDIIEAGFAAASPDDLTAIQDITKEVGIEPTNGRPCSEPPVICSLARACRSDIDKAAKAVAAAKHPRIHTFIATSPIHLEHKLHMTQAQTLRTITQMVSHARSYCEDIEFTPEDASRSEIEFLYEVIQAAIESGASTVNIADTVGYTTPEEFGELILTIRERVPNIDKTIISVHCHNDLGLAVANSLAAIQHGARQIEGTINGIGERAGNASLEEIIMALYVRQHLYQIRTNIDTTQLTRASEVVSMITGILVPPNKAVVGANAFAHEAGIHQDGILKHKNTYEIMTPDTVGALQTQLVIGKHSGRHAFSKRLEALGYPISGDQLIKTFTNFKKLADSKKTITDIDLITLVSSEILKPQQYWKLDTLKLDCGTNGSSATIQLIDPKGKTQTASKTGSGPIDATYKAIQQLIDIPCTLIEYKVQSITKDIDAFGQVLIRLQPEKPKLFSDGLNAQTEQWKQRTYHGTGFNTDIMIASATAYINAINRMIATTQESLEENRQQAEDVA